MILLQSPPFQFQSVLFILSYFFNFQQDMLSSVSGWPDQIPNTQGISLNIHGLVSFSGVWAYRMRNIIWPHGSHCWTLASNVLHNSGREGGRRTTKSSLIKGLKRWRWGYEDVFCSFLKNSYCAVFRCVQMFKHCTDKWHNNQLNVWAFGTFGTKIEGCILNACKMSVIGLVS